MLLQRLKNHRTMDDGVLWSAQSDFIARLADWEKDTDIVWPLQRTERSSLLALNIPHFVSPVDQIEIRDATGVAIRIKTESGLDRAQARAQNLDEDEIKWQIEVIKENTSALSIASGPAAVDCNVIIASRSKALIEPDEQTSSERPTKSPTSYRLTQFAAGQEPRGLVGTGWAMRKFSSSCAWGQTSTMAYPASQSFSPRMQQ